jgi:hypothetical protein
MDRTKSWRVSWDYGVGCPVVNRPISWELSSSYCQSPAAASLPSPLPPVFGDASSSSTVGVKRRLLSVVVRTLIEWDAMGEGQMFAHRLNEDYSTYGSFMASGEIFDPINWGCYDARVRSVNSALDVRGPIIVHDYNTWVQLITARNPWKSDLPGSQNRARSCTPTTRPFVFYAVFRRSMYIPDEDDDDEDADTEGADAEDGTRTGTVGVPIKEEEETATASNERSRPNAVKGTIRNGFYDDDPLRCFVLRHGSRTYEEIRTFRGAPSRHRSEHGARYDDEGDDAEEGSGAEARRQPSWDRNTLRYEGASPLIYISIESLAKLLDDESQARGFLRLGLKPITLSDMPDEVEYLRAYFAGTPHDVVRFDRPCSRPPSDPDGFID